MRSNRSPDSLCDERGFYRVSLLRGCNVTDGDQDAVRAEQQPVVEIGVERASLWHPAGDLQFFEQRWESGELRTQPFRGSRRLRAIARADRAQQIGWSHCAAGGGVSAEWRWRVGWTAADRFRGPSPDFDFAHVRR